jgi:hypothetical protein
VKIFLKDGKKKTLKGNIRTILKRLSGDENYEDNMTDMLKDVLGKKFKVNFDKKYEDALKLIAKVNKC